LPILRETQRFKSGLKTSLRRKKLKQKHFVETGLKDFGREGMDWIHLAKTRVQFLSLIYTGSVEGG
jgi:hypothetical protein